MNTPKRKYAGPAIEAAKISFNYKNIKAVDRLSLEVPRGISFGVLGPNGSGKTTLIRLFVGLLRPKSGTIRTLGRPPSRKMARHIGYMPQLASLYAELSIAQNVDFFARIYGVRAKAKRRQLVEEAIKLVGLWPRRRDSVHKLSGGMKQRVSLACAIVHKPPLLFLDEPTVGVDPALRVTFWKYFENLTRQGVTIIISSHTMDDAAHCDRLVFLRQGKIIAEGTPHELRQSTRQPEASLEDAFLYFVRYREKGNDSK
ncbi:MAG: ABC transporter ATP-binding protein [Dehalococcoidia bacterium]|nr:ABC transporter ATP-binding protein [Dehalococcoidia bacterium]MCK5653683.1 ABC transporter ATP-binding protein [Dehalococcoidia bacterium]